SSLVFCFFLTFLFFFSTDIAPSVIYTLSLHDALPISINMDGTGIMQAVATVFISQVYDIPLGATEILLIILTATLASIMSKISRSEEHTSELQSRFDLVCRLLLEKKKNNKITIKNSKY